MNSLYLHLRNGTQIIMFQTSGCGSKPQPLNPYPYDYDFAVKDASAAQSQSPPQFALQSYAAGFRIWGLGYTLREHSLKLYRAAGRALTEPIETPYTTIQHHSLRNQIRNYAHIELIQTPREPQEKYSMDPEVILDGIDEASDVKGIMQDPLRGFEVQASGSEPLRGLKWLR